MAGHGAGHRLKENDAWNTAMMLVPHSLHQHPSDWPRHAPPTTDRPRLTVHVFLLTEPWDTLHLLALLSPVTTTQFYAATSFSGQLSCLGEYKAA